MKRQIMSNSAFMNSTDVIMDKKKEKLRNKLKQDVSREEQSIASSKTAENRRISCISILDAVDEFLGVWEEELEEFSGLPRDFLRQTLSKVVRELGPGNADLRESVFSTLQSTTSKECRQIILDFLPLAMPLRNDRENKVEVLQILKIGFEEDPSIVAPVLECLSAMRNSGRLMGKDIFQFIVQVILKVPDESPFHNMIRCLIENITSQNDAIIAVEVVRTELRSVEELGSIVNERCIASIAEELLILKNEGNSCLFFEVYLSVLEDILRENADTKGTSLGGEPLIAVDIVIILLYLECGERSGQVERMFDAALTQSSLSLDMLCFLLRALVQEKRTSEITSGPLFEDSTRSDLFISLLDSLVSLALFLLLSPIRIREFEKVSTLTKGFVLDLLLKLDQERQRRLISSMMHLDEELFRNINETSVESTIKPVFESKGHFTDPSENNIRKVCIVVFEILNGVAKKSIQTMIPFKQVLVNKLRSGDFIEEYHDDTLQQLCSLISYLEASRHKATMETDQVVPDVFLTIRRLLFSQPRIVSPSDELRNDASCIRGLVLATTVVSGNHLSHAKTLTVWQSVRMVLLPSTNRSINPRVGLYALKFVRVLARWNKKDNVETFSFIEQQIFQTMTRVLSNSRIIQYVTSFDERQKEDSTLYYTERPPFFGIGARKRKVRKMIVSFKTFFPDKFTVSPSGWKDSSQWVFDLVDTYLSIGRTVSLSSENKGGWSPHPWVEAALEVPRLDISRLKAIGTRQRRSLQLMQKELSSRDISNCNDTLSDGLDKDVSDMIRNTKDSNDFEEMLHSMFRFTLSLILGLTMTAAVLNNTYRRYRDILRDIEDNSSCGKKMEALKQLQHQLVKIYDLRRMCQSMQRMFLSMTTTTRYLSSKAGKKRKRGKSQRGPSVGNKVSLNVFQSFFERCGSILFYQQLVSQLQIASEQLKAVLSHLFGTEDFIRSEILWACLVDPTQDRVVTNAVENDRGESLLSMGTDELKNMAIIVDVKLNVLEHLIAQIRHFSLLGGDREPKISLLASKRTMLIVRSRLAQCFRLCSYLSLHLPRLLQDFSNWRLDKVFSVFMICNRSSLCVLKIFYFLPLHLPRAVVWISLTTYHH